MQSLNSQKIKLKNELIEDKFGLSKNVVLSLKSEMIDVLKKYTKFDNDDIKLTIKVLSKNKYLINFSAEVDDVF